MQRALSTFGEIIAEIQRNSYSLADGHTERVVSYASRVESQGVGKGRMADFSKTNVVESSEVL